MKLTDEPTGPEGLTWLEYEIKRQSAMIHDAMRDDPRMQVHDAGRKSSEASRQTAE